MAKLGAVFDAGRRAFPGRQQISGVQWTAMDHRCAKTVMLARGDIDAITGFTFTSLLSLEARGVKAGDVVVFTEYPDYGVSSVAAPSSSTPSSSGEPGGDQGLLTRYTKGRGRTCW